MTRGYNPHQWTLNTDHCKRRNSVEISLSGRAPPVDRDFVAKWKTSFESDVAIIHQHTCLEVSQWKKHPRFLAVAEKNETDKSKFIQRMVRRDNARIHNETVNEDERRSEEVQLAVCGMWRPTGLDKSRQDLGQTR